MEQVDEHLEVWLHEVRAGTLHRTPQRLDFQYADAYLARPDAQALSKRLPLEPGRFRYGEALRWFDALLPEGARREQAARQAGAASMSTFSMLQAIGAECAGAVEVRRPGSKLEAKKAPASMEEIEEYIRRMDRYPLGPDPGQLTLSLAGAQPKLVLVKESDGWSWPLGGYPSTHVVKPEQEGFPGVVWNEHACMTLAHRAGLACARTEVRRFGRFEALVVERFDRTADGRRVHQEDFAQAFGAREKYQKDGGPSLKDCFERSGVGGPALWDQVMFAWLTGDEDKHAKNFSIQYPGGEAPRLAPIYDAVCTLAYPDLARGMAMRIGNAWQVREVDRRAIEDEARKCGLRPGEAVQRLRALAERVREAMEEMNASGWDLGLLEAGGIGTRLDASCEWAKESGGGRHGL